MKQFVIVFVGLLAVVNAVSFLDAVREEWQAFKLKHLKQYKSGTEQWHRQRILIYNRNIMSQHNETYENGQVSYKLAMNKYGDLLHHEFLAQRKGSNFTAQSGFRITMHKGGIKRTKEPLLGQNRLIEVPKSIDWRDMGAVTEVVDQGVCGSCYAFSAAGGVEGQHFLNTGVLVSLSKQNIIDCSKPYGNNGCDGGLMNNACQYIIDNGGIESEEKYPYENHDNEDDQVCIYDPKYSVATIKGFVNIPEGNEEKLVAALGTVGPVSVAIDASPKTLQFYKAGIYYSPKCTQKVDHDVFSVGYGTDESGMDYYIVKNRWGADWGEQGYIRMARKKNSHCGIASLASYTVM